MDELTTYYYVLTAFDEVPNNSSYSNIAFDTTVLGPHGPVINNSINDFSIPEDTIDDSTINLYHWFKDINNDSFEFKCEGNENISATIFQQNGTVILIPKKNWNGRETLIFYANDSIFEVFDKVTIMVTPVNDPPGPALIITPKDGLKVDNGTVVNFSGICDDVDLIYGDKLTFNWSSNISGRIGNGENLTNIILQPGQHQITLEVSDIAGETSIAMVNIIIFENITPDHIPKFDIKLELVPNSIRLKPGEETSVKAIVTNLGELKDNFTVTVGGINNTKIEAKNYRQDTLEIEPGKNKEFLIMIRVEENTKPGFENITITAKSKLAERYNLHVQDSQMLSIKILKKDIQKERGQPISIFYFSILLLIFILIIISIIILIIVRKKVSKKESEVVKSQDIIPETTVEPLPVVIEQQHETLEE